MVSERDRIPERLLRRGKPCLEVTQIRHRAFQNEGLLPAARRLPSPPRSAGSKRLPAELQCSLRSPGKPHGPPRPKTLNSRAITLGHGARFKFAGEPAPEARNRAPGGQAGQPGARRSKPSQAYF